MIGERRAREVGNQAEISRVEKKKREEDETRSRRRPSSTTAQPYQPRGKARVEDVK